MEQASSAVEREARERPVGVRGRSVPHPTSEGAAGYRDRYAHLECLLCAARFVVDLEQVWSAPLDEVERVGRQFVGVSPDACLCPRCLREVELAGAERMYWKLVHC